MTSHVCCPNLWMLVPTERRENKNRKLPCVADAPRQKSCGDEGRSREFRRRMAGVQERGERALSEILQVVNLKGPVKSVFATEAVLECDGTSLKLIVLILKNPQWVQWRTPVIPPLFKAEAGVYLCEFKASFVNKKSSGRVRAAK